MRAAWFRRRVGLRDILIGIGALIGLIVLWLTVSYRGIVALAAEWQFDTFGRYYPSATYMLYLLLMLVPIWGFVVVRRRVRRRRGVVDSVPDPIQTALVIRGVFLVLGGACLVVAVISLLTMLTLPSATGEVHVVEVATTPSREIRQGPTQLVGSINYLRTAAFDQDLWLVRRSTRFAPMNGIGPDGRTVRFFIELAPEERPSVSSTELRRGILREEGLPGELIRLYRYVGYRFDNPYYVLFSSAESMRWPYFVVAGEYVLGGCVFAAFALLQRLFADRLRRLSHTSRQRDEEAVPAKQKVSA